jgi:hypothetical protein
VRHARYEFRRYQALGNDSIVGALSHATIASGLLAALI